MAYDQERAELPASRPALVASALGSAGRRSARRRLQTARGHLDAVLRMMDADRYCVDILHQLAAVDAAIMRARQDIIEGHVRGCAADAARDGVISIDDLAGEALAAVLGSGAPLSRVEQRIVP